MRNDKCGAMKKGSFLRLRGKGGMGAKAMRMMNENDGYHVSAPRLMAVHASRPVFLGTTATPMRCSTLKPERETAARRRFRQG